MLIVRIFKEYCHTDDSDGTRSVIYNRSHCSLVQEQQGIQDINININRGREGGRRGRGGGGVTTNKILGKNVNPHA